MTPDASKARGLLLSSPILTFFMVCSRDPQTRGIGLTILLLL